MACKNCEVCHIYISTTINVMYITYLEWILDTMYVIGEKRFRKGDWIRVEGIVEGTVEKIGFRSTIIRRFDKAPVMVPNTHLGKTVKRVPLKLN